MTKDEFNTLYDALITSDEIDLTKADELKTNLSSVFDDLETVKKDNEFYINKIDDLKRQNRELYTKSKVTVEATQVPQDETPKKTPYEMFSEAMGDYKK